LGDILDFLAGKATEDPFFLGSLLADFARSEGLDDLALAARLGCAPADLVRLRLCRAPRSEQPGFEEDVACIATRFGIDRERLAEVVLRGQTLQEFRKGSAASSHGLLAAARELEPPDEAKDEEKEN